MRIEAADSTGRIEPQFVVYAENEQDRAILKMFIGIQYQSNEKLVFHLHGWCSNQNSQYTSFNFGWITKKAQTPGQVGDNYINMKEKVTRDQLKIGETKVKHTTSGFQGVVNGVAEYQNNRMSVGIQPVCVDQSKLPKDEWFNIEDIELVS